MHTHTQKKTDLRDIVIIRLHRSTSYEHMQHIATDILTLRDLAVCLSVAIISHANTDEPIEMPIGVQI